MTIVDMRIACWIPKATNTYSEYVIIIVLHCNNDCTNASRCYVIGFLGLQWILSTEHKDLQFKLTTMHNDLQLILARIYFDLNSYQPQCILMYSLH